MKNKFKILAVAFLLSVFATGTFAQVTLNSSATAVIVTTIAMTKQQDLHFGNLAVTTTAGTCVLTPMAGVPTRSITGGVTLPAFIGTPLAAQFTVTGVGGQYFTIYIPPDVTVITLGANSMDVDTYTTDQTLLSANNWRGQLDATNGDRIFYVGATCHVNASQAPGTYTNAGGFPVTVNYQ